MSEPNRRTVGRTSSPSYVGLSLIAAAFIAVSGCESKTSAEKLRDAGFDPASRAVSFLAIAEQLNNLDQAVKVQGEARIPADVIVDATRSTDQRPVLAGVTDGPHRGGVFAFVHVPQGNVDFVARGVRAGDVVDYHVETPNPDNPAEMRRQTVKLFVVEVLDKHTLRIDPPLPPLGEGASYPPFPIVISRLDRSREDRTERSLARWQVTGEPAEGWELTPESDAIDQLVLQLNQWAERDDTAFAWEPDPLVAAASEQQNAEFADIGAEKFASEDGRILEEAVWLRDISRRAAGAGDPLARATAMFDWTVRNLQLETNDSLLGIRQRPWQALVSGRATAEERAWVFILLLRQLNIDAVALSAPVGDEPDAEREFWAVAVRIGDDWRLFDTRLGLPIPGPNGEGIATLGQAKADAGIFAQLDIVERDAEGNPTAQHIYPVTNSAAARAVALVEATPLYLSRRARRIELQLAGTNRVALSTSPSRVAEAMRPHVAGVELWTIGTDTRDAQRKLSTAARSLLVEQFLTFARVTGLWKGRVLQFRGDDHRVELDHADRPVRVYARQRDPRWYFTQWCRPSDYDLEHASPAEYHVDSMRYAKQMATVWMGEVCFEAGDYGEAVAYFGERTLDRRDSPPLRALARSNLAGTHERIAEQLDALAGQFASAKRDGGATFFPTPELLLALALAEAARAQRGAAEQLYLADDSPQRHGSLLRARRLAERAEAPGS